jgi:methyltransferase (TIGR00027 family)
MNTQSATIPDHTAVRVALWRALHVQLDSAPHVLEDEIGLQLLGPDPAWQERPDMNPQWTRGYRASIAGRARFIEDLVLEQLGKGVTQYVILGAGLDTFAQRHPELASVLQTFEIDQPETQAWKRKRLMELDYGVPNHLKLVPVDFEAGESWQEKLKANGFDASKPAVIASTGVAMYLTLEANKASLREIATLATGSTLAMTFMLPTDLVEPDERAQYEMVQERARSAGTPFLSLFRPTEILELARSSGFQEVGYVSRAELIQRYFAARADGLQPASGEEFLIAKT